MMNIYTIHVSLILTILLLYWFLPTAMPETLLFGVRIPPSHCQDPVLVHARREYQTGILVIGLLVIAAGWFGATHYSPIFAGLISIFATLLLTGLNYYAAHQRIARVKARENWYQGLKQVVMTDTELHVHPIRPSIVWLPIPVIFLLAMIVVAIIRYPALPAVIPTHFGLNGQPNAWTNKTMGVLMLPLTATIITALMIALAYYLPNTRQQLDPTNPQEDRLRQTHTRRALANMLLILAGTTNLILFFTSLMVLQVLPTMSGTGISLIASILPLGIGLATLIVLMRQNRSRSHNASQQTSVARDDDRYWIAGAFYSNPDDPSLMVEKRFGLGWTINFGHPLAKVISITFVLIIVLSIVFSTLAR